MKTVVCIPTYNEKENVEPITLAVLAATGSDTHVLVIDDNSPDGTGEIVRGLIAKQGEAPRMHLLSRPGKQGLGRAYIAGFKWALDHGYDVIVEMDADFSHRPEDLVKILAAVQSKDFAVGSRYVPNGSTVNWGLLRKIISKGGSLYTRLILGYPLADWTGGFNAWKSKVLKGIDLDQVLSNGYSFQIELKYRALKHGFDGIEVPIVFEDRRVGKSKMSMKIVLEAFTRVWAMRF
ncbi:MAG: polyprenol monophosphomannose synthase [Proteobacteria bacterium]|nr:MAG: polyprenol monophosphomannose synthase [Pseudomonadota bacterium]